MAVGALVPPDATRVATVYTNAPKQLRETVFVDLCTLLRHHTCPQRRNSVHKCPKTAPRDRFRRSVYTLLHPHDRSRDRAELRVPRHQRPHGLRDARALGPDGPSVSCQVRAPSRPISSVPVVPQAAIVFRRRLGSKAQAQVGQTPPVSFPTSVGRKTGGVVSHTTFERVRCVCRCHVPISYSWTTTTSPISVSS